MGARKFRALLQPITRLGVLLGLLLGSLAISIGSFVYFDSDELPPFVIEKLPLPHEALWLAALKVHVVAAAFSLPACLALLSKTLVRRAPRVHRWLGRCTGLVVLFALAPSGLYLSPFAKGGFPSTVGFVASGVIVIVAMVQGIRTARARNVVDHRRWSLHVLGQLSVAVSSRTMLFLFDALSVDANVAYLASLWIPVLGTFVVVELFSPRRRSLFNGGKDHEGTSRIGPDRRNGVVLDGAGV